MRNGPIYHFSLFLDGRPVSEWVLRSGADSYLAKPFKVKDLIQRVEDLLQTAGAVSPSA